MKIRKWRCASPVTLCLMCRWKSFLIRHSPFLIQLWLEWVFVVCAPFHLFFFLFGLFFGYTCPGVNIFFVFSCMSGSVCAWQSIHLFMCIMSVCVCLGLSICLPSFYLYFLVSPCECPLNSLQFLVLFLFVPFFHILKVPLRLFHYFIVFVLYTQ